MPPSEDTCTQHWISSMVHYWARISTRIHVSRVSSHVHVETVASVRHSYSREQKVRAIADRSRRVFRSRHESRRKTIRYPPSDLWNRVPSQGTTSRVASPDSVSRLFRARSVSARRTARADHNRSVVVISVYFVVFSIYWFFLFCSFFSFLLPFFLFR